MRVSSGNTENMNWTLHLRGGLQNKPDKQWKRYFSRPHKSFDQAKETLKSDGYRDMNTSVRLEANQKFERNQNALPIETIRDQPIVSCVIVNSNIEISISLSIKVLLLLLLFLKKSETYPA